MDDRGLLTDGRVEVMIGRHRVAVGAAEPAVELPADAVGQALGGEAARRAGPLVAPEPHPRGAADGAGLDPDAQARQAVALQPLVQFLGEGAGGERGGVDAVDRWVELHRRGQVGRDGRGVERPLVEAGGQPMGAGAERPEAGQHVRRRERGERGERAQAQPAEQLDELGEVLHHRGP